MALPFKMTFKLFLASLSLAVAANFCHAMPSPMLDAPPVPQPSPTPPPLTTNETWVTKTLNHIGLLQLRGHRSLGDWCRGVGSAIELGSFQSAQFIDGLVEGFYHCQGEFVNTPEKPQVILFRIDSCLVLDVVEQRRSCPPVP